MLPDVIHGLTLADIQERWAARKLRGVFQVSDGAYHGGPGLSSTGVKALLKSPAHFKAGQADSDALFMGRAFHCAVLEPERFKRDYAAAPSCDRRTKAGKQFYDAWEATVTGKTILGAQEAAQVNAVAEACRASTLFRQIVQGARFEIAAYAQENVDGHAILTKAKADIAVPGIIADLKSCEDVSADAFAQAVIRWGYHISAAYYVDVFSRATMTAPCDFMWICVEKRAPYALKYYHATPEMLRIGRMEYERALAIYAKCQATNTWAAAEAIEDLELPTYYARKFA